MSLNKAIAHGKEKRKPYRGGKAWSKGCRNHGGCSYCEDNRLHRHRRQQPQVDVTVTGYGVDL